MEADVVVLIRSLHKLDATVRVVIVRLHCSLDNLDLVVGCDMESSDIVQRQRHIPSTQLTEVSGRDDVVHDAVGPPVSLVDDAVVPARNVTLWKFPQFLWVH